MRYVSIIRVASRYGGLVRAVETTKAPALASWWLVEFCG
jgi:hypothetical protein